MWVVFSWQSRAWDWLFHKSDARKSVCFSPPFPSSSGVSSLSCWSKMTKSRTFAVAGHRLWNSLSLCLQHGEVVRLWRFQIFRGGRLCFCVISAGRSDICIYVYRMCNAVLGLTAKYSEQRIEHSKKTIDKLCKSVSYNIHVGLTVF